MTLSELISTLGCEPDLRQRLQADPFGELTRLKLDPADIDAMHSGDVERIRARLSPEDIELLKKYEGGDMKIMWPWPWPPSW